MKRIFLAVLLFSGVGLWSVPVLAIDLFTGCRISATSVDFGVYDPLSSLHDDNAGEIELSCGSLVELLGSSISYTVKLSSGGSGSPTLRKMSKDSDKLEYNLYIDSLHQTFWGETATHTRTGTFNYSGAVGVIVVKTARFPVYGRIYKGQLVPKGTYTDSITATVLY